MVDLTKVSPASSRSSSPSPIAPSNATGKDATLLNHDALTLFGVRKPHDARKPLLPAPQAPHKATPKIRPLPLVDPDIASAFAAAGMPVVRGSVTERAAQHITRELRDMLRGRPPSSAAPVPFHQPLEAAYSAVHKGAVNNACYQQLADIRESLVSVLSRYCDHTTAVSAAAKAQPIIVWNNADPEHGWDIDLQSGAFIDALWQILGGRHEASTEAFDALLKDMRDAVREPMEDVLFASEERFRDLVDCIAALVVDAQQRR